MSDTPNIWTIPSGTAFLPTLAESIITNRLFDGTNISDLTVADATIYVPTRRAARTLRTHFVEMTDGAAAILPTIRPLGEFDDDGLDFLDLPGSSLDVLPPVDQYERLFALAPLVRAWKSRLPAHVASLFDEELIVPASGADAIWLARDLAALLDEVETSEVSWAALGDLVPEELAHWWQVTLDFLKIVTEHWPRILDERQRSDPAAWRSLQINRESERLRAGVNRGPVIAAGSTGSIPATARLLTAIAKHPLGAVVLPGLDTQIDEDSWSLIGRSKAAPSVFGHPQYGLKKLLGAMAATRDDVRLLAEESSALSARFSLINEALRPAEVTDKWLENTDKIRSYINEGALDHVALIEAPEERSEALSIAIALRSAVSEAGHRAALVTSDRNLARRASTELLRFGIIADDSGGRPLAATPPASLLQLLAEAAFRPGDPAILLDLLAHPLMLCGIARVEARRLATFAELVLLRGASGRPDIKTVAQQFDARIAVLQTQRHLPLWFSRIGDEDTDNIRQFLLSIGNAVSALCSLRSEADIAVGQTLVELVKALEALGRDEAGAVDALYSGDNGESLANVLRSLIASDPTLTCKPVEFPDVLAALLATETVKPSAAGDGRIAIWGALEARLQSVDTLVVAGLNEGSWPGKAETGRFMSRVLSGGMGLEPPERRTGQAAHDFQMALGSKSVVLTRAKRADGAPASRSRWLQRLLAVIGEEASSELTARGMRYLSLAGAIDLDQETEPKPRFDQPCPAPPLEARPLRFSVTEIETLRRDPYAIYAKRILRLEPIDPLSRNPGAADRGSLFHDILHRFTASGIKPENHDAEARLLEIAADCFGRAGLPAEIHAVWWPRFVRLAPGLIAWERDQSRGVREKHTEISASPILIDPSCVSLSGRADRIDVLDGRQYAEILDYKTGGNPTKSQARRLLAPQLALEGALLARGAFGELGQLKAADLKFIRLKADGTVAEESIGNIKGAEIAAEQLAQEAWERLAGLIQHYSDQSNGYRSRALPMREHDMDGDYDHLARVLEWSSGAGGEVAE